MNLLRVVFWSACFNRLVPDGNGMGWRGRWHEPGANDGRVKPGDKLVRVDGFDCMGVTELAQTLLEQKLFFSCASCKTACAPTSTPFPSIHPFAYACSTRTCNCRHSPPGSYHPVQRGPKRNTR